MKNLKIYKNLDIIRNLKLNLVKTISPIFIVATISVINTIAFREFAVGEINKEYNEIISPDVKTEELIIEEVIEEKVEVPKPPLMTAEEINKEISHLGKITLEGMPGAEYDEAINREWIKIKPEGKFEFLDIDLKKVMNYNKVEEYLLNMAKYDGVNLFSIGKTVQGRNIYMVEVVLPKEGETKEERDKRPTIMITGNIHAREGAGCEFSIKNLNDTLKESFTDPYKRELLKNVRITFVPLANPDGRETIINGGNPSRKSNGIGVDFQRNFPAINGGQQAIGIPKLRYMVGIPGIEFFPGPYLGSEEETKALISWMEKYVPIASYYIDLHQQGNIIYYEKMFLDKNMDKLSKSASLSISAMLNNQYSLYVQRDDYGVDGGGGTPTDYARGIAEGMTFSYKYGRQVMIIDGKETLLVDFKDIDKVKEHNKPVNPNFTTMTVEIGSGPAYTGYGDYSLTLRNNLYFQQNWNNFLKNISEKTLGIEKVDILKKQLEEEKDVESMYAINGGKTKY